MSDEEASDTNESVRQVLVGALGIVRDEITRARSLTADAAIQLMSCFTGMKQQIDRQNVAIDQLAGAVASAASQEAPCDTTPAQQATAASREALAGAKGHAHEAVRALQFEDMVSQLVSSSLGRLEALETVCDGLLRACQDGAVDLGALAPGDHARQLRT